MSPDDEAGGLKPRHRQSCLWLEFCLFAKILLLFQHVLSKCIMFDGSTTFCCGEYRGGYLGVWAPSNSIDSGLDRPIYFR
jgi:hypothetical protein